MLDHHSADDPQCPALARSARSSRCSRIPRSPRRSRCRSSPSRPARSTSRLSASIETWIVASLLYVAHLHGPRRAHARSRAPAVGSEVAAMDPVRFCGSWSGSPAMPILKGLGMTVSISALAIVAGTVLGVLVGLSLTYGVLAAALAGARLYRFHPRHAGLVLVLASYYVLSHRRPRPDCVPGRRSGADGVLRLACRRDPARRPAGDSRRPDGGGEGDRADLPPDLHLRARAAGAASGPADLGQHRRRDGQGLDAAVDHRRRRAAAAHAGDSSRATS